MGRSILVAVLAAGVALLAATTDTTAQQASPAPRPYAPPVGTEPPPRERARLRRDLHSRRRLPVPGAGQSESSTARTYGYRAPVYGYYRTGYARARYYRDRCRTDRHWAGDRCGRRWY